MSGWSMFTDAWGDQAGCECATRHVCIFHCCAGVSKSVNTAFKVVDRKGEQILASVAPSKKEQGAALLAQLKSVGRNPPPLTPSPRLVHLKMNVFTPRSTVVKRMRCCLFSMPPLAPTCHEPRL